VANIIIPRTQINKPTSARPLYFGNDVFSPKSIYHGFNSFAPHVDEFCGAAGTLSGSAYVNQYGLVTSSGNYLTGSTNRPKYTGSTLTAIFEIELGAGAVWTSGGAVLSHFIGTSGDQFIQGYVGTSSLAFTVARFDLYIAGSYRTGVEAQFIGSSVV